VSQSQ
jgi:hypothetical protein